MRKRTATLVLAAALIAALPGTAALGAPGDRTPIGTKLAQPARNAKLQDAGSQTFTFYGSGFGHGIGLSQWGAYGLAQMGWTHQQILARYYSGSAVGPVPARDAASQIRVGLTWDRTVLHLKAIGGDVILRRGHPSDANFLTIPSGYEWTVQAVSPGQFKITNATGQVVATVGGPTWQLDAIFKSPSSHLYIPEAYHTYSRGYVEMNVYRSCSSCTWLLRAVGVMSPQEYLYGVGEVPSTWPMEAMEAQADAARTFAFNEIASHGQHRTDHGNCNCGLYPSSIDQAYLGWDKESQGPGWPKAVDATDGETILYKGDLVFANYYTSSGGYTEDNENVWFDPPIPYLRAVCDPGDYTSANPVRTWTRQISAAQVSADLARYGYNVGTITSFWPIQRSVSGRVIHIWANGTGGSDGTKVEISGPVFSSALGLMDDKVFINVNRNVTGSIRATYDSLNCGPGLASGPAYKVPNGVVQHFSNGAIYFSNARQRSTWVAEPLYDVYVALGGVKGLLGLPIDAAVPLKAPPGCAQATCLRQGFDGGRIYYKQGVGGFEVHGLVMGFWLQTGGAQGPLGFPTSDVKTLPDGSHQSTFEHGAVTCPTSGVCTQA